MLLFMPTLVYSEENCVKNHFKDIALIGEKAMIITGKHSSRSNGSLRCDRSPGKGKYFLYYI